MSVPLMPKATAVWLIDNTTLSFDQIAGFCQMHTLEVQAIADGEIAAGIIGRDPITAGELDLSEIIRCQGDPTAVLQMKESSRSLDKKPKRAKYTPISRRQDKPSGIAWVVKNYPKISDADIARLIGSTKNTIQSIRDGSHAHSKDMVPKDPVTLGLCSQTELDGLIEKSHKTDEAV